MPARDEILNRIKLVSDGNTLFNQVEPDWEKEELIDLQTDLIAQFGQELEKVNGLFFAPDDVTKLDLLISEILGSEGLTEAYSNLSFVTDNITCKRVDKLTDTCASIVNCEALIAASGSVLVSSANNNGRKQFVFPPVLIVLATANQLVPYLKDGLDRIKKSYKQLPSMLSLITGPSRTADIEKTLVLGAHGSKKLIVVLLPETEQL